MSSTDESLKKNFKMKSLFRAMSPKQTASSFSILISILKTN